MSQDETEFVPYEFAKKIVGAVMEEEHLHEPERRVLTVYDINNQELCWFDAEEILAEIENPPKNKDDLKVAAVELIMHRIPAWAVDEVLKDVKARE